MLSMNDQLFHAIQQERLDQAAELRRERRQRDQEKRRAPRGDDSGRNPQRKPAR